MRLFRFASVVRWELIRRTPQGTEKTVGVTKGVESAKLAKVYARHLAVRRAKR